MSTSAVALESRRATWVGRLADYVELTKPKIAALVLVTVAVSALVARWGQPDPFVLCHALLGTLLVAASASALNQWIERRRDALMDRTAARPLPAGRLRAGEVLAFGAATLIAGVAYLALAVNVTAAAVGLLTWLLYVALYTPLKSYTWLNTPVGAVAGAMPVLIGWAASGASLDLRAAALFLVVYLWQFPHFMAIAWIYRRQYDRAGMQMLTVVDPSGRRAAVQAVLAATALLPVSLVPALVAPTAAWYVILALILGVGYLACALAFWARISESTARLLLRASLVYLPSLLAVWVAAPFL
jgi:protoheme IX farnesyltransferase